MEGIYDNILVVIPSLNPDDKLMKLLEDLKAGGFPHVLVVNDGSAEDYAPYFQRAEEEFGCEVLRHYINFGKGRALKTAFNHFLNAYPACKGLVTVDADGQHKVPDIRACCDAMLAHPEALILGSRDFSKEDVPFKSHYGNVITRNVFRLLCGVRISDTQTGLRAMSSPLVKRFLTTKGERFEYEMNMLIDCAEDKIPLREVPIETVYIEENASSHFHPVLDSIKIYAVFGKFLFSSVSSFLVDIIMFTMLSWVLRLAAPELLTTDVPHIKITYAILIATAAARVISSLWNYLLNRKLVFQSKANGAVTLVKYYALAVVILFLSAQGVSFFTHLTGWNSTVVKIPIDMLLFLISFPIQKHWVFKKEKAPRQDGLAA